MREKQFGILGLGRFGESVALRLASLGAEVIAVDRSEEKVNRIAEYVSYAVTADVTDINSLKAIGLKNVDVAVISITSDVNANIMAVINCQELGIEEVCSKTNSPQHGKVLEKLGVSRVYAPEKDMGDRVAKQLYNGDFFSELSLNQDYSIVEIDPLKSWYGHRLADLDIRNQHKITVVAIAAGDETNIAPAPTDIIPQGARLFILGSNQDIAKLRERINRGE